MSLFQLGTSKDVLGGGGGSSRFQRWWRSSRDDVEQVLGLVAAVAGRAPELMRLEAGLRQFKALWRAGLLRMAILHSCLVRKSFLSNAEPGLGGRGQKEYNPLGFLQSACSVLTWLLETGEGLRVGERSTY